MRRRLDSAQFWSAFGAAVIALGGVLILVSSIGLSPGKKPSEPWYVLGRVLAVLGAAGLVWAFVLFVRQKYAEYRARPGLTVNFDPSDPQCVQDRRNQPESDFQLRLRATNTGGVALTGVRCRLKAGHDHYGRIRHDNTPPFELSRNGIHCRPAQANFRHCVLSLRPASDGPPIRRRISA